MTYGETGIQASKAFVVLGMRYEQLGEFDLAIENYSKSLEAYQQPYGMTYFWQGKLYYQQQKWEAARDDFTKALSLEEQLLSPEKEETKQLLQDLNQHLR